MANAIQQLTTTSADQGEVVSVVGDTYRLIITGEQSNGAYAVIDMLVPPGGGPGPHAHAAIQEGFYILNGEIEVTTEEKTYTAKKGAYVNIPAGGMVHCFKNRSESIAHMICIVTPSGLDAFFREIGQPVEAGHFLPPPVMDRKTMEKLKEAAEKYGQKLYPPDYFKNK